MSKIEVGSWTGTGWKMVSIRLAQDNYALRLICKVATGRKYWPIFSELANLEMGQEDPMIDEIRRSIFKYTHPMVDRFVNELEVALSDFYQVPIRIGWNGKTYGTL